MCVPWSGEAGVVGCGHAPRHDVLTIVENRSDSDALRARAIVASLRAGEPSSEEVFAAFEELDGLPVEVVRSALGAWIGPVREQDPVDDATRLARNLPSRPLRLRTLAIVKDADLLDLGPIAEEQLRLAGLSFDGADLPAEERLDGEMEGSFAGGLEHRVLADADAQREQPLFDVLLYAEDAGVVFRAGTTDLIGMISYGSVEMSDRRARAAIQEALASTSVVGAVVEAVLAAVVEVVAAVVEEEAPETPDPPAPAKAPAKTAAKRTTAKKTTAKKRPS